HARPGRRRGGLRRRAGDDLRPDAGHPGRLQHAARRALHRRLRGRARCHLHRRRGAPLRHEHEPRAHPGLGRLRARRRGALGLPHRATARHAARRRDLHPPPAPARPDLRQAAPCARALHLRLWLRREPRPSDAACNAAGRTRDCTPKRRRPQTADWERAMKAIAVYPGQPGSMHLRDVPLPRIEDVPGGRGVLVKVLRVGVDGTDKEINAAAYGHAPAGDDYLITGHENFSQVVALGPTVPDSLRPGTYVVASVRRPGRSIYDQIGLQDMTTDDVYYERGINLRHGYLAEYYVEDAAYLVPLPDSLRDVGVLLEPLTVAEKGLNQAFEIQRRLKVWQPRSAAVLGAGTIGLLAALAMRLRRL